MATHRILIVDDQRDARRVLRSGLETLKHEVKIQDVPSGEEGLLLLSRQHFDLLIADIRLPGISGLELVKRAHVLNPAMKFILVTGMTDRKVRREMEEAGAYACFFKPLEMNEFLARVEECLGLTTPATVVSAPADVKPASPPVEARPAPPAKPAIRQDETPVAVPASRSGAKPATPTPPQPTPPVAATQPPPGVVFSRPAHRAAAAYVAPPVVEPPPPPPEPEPDPRQGLSQRLSSLRQNLGAVCTALLDDDGEVVARAGELPDNDFETVLLTALGIILGASARVSLLLGSSAPHNLLFFKGQQFNIHISHLSQSLALLMLVPATPDELSLDRVKAEMRAAVQDLLNILLQMGVSLPGVEVEDVTPAPVEPPVEEQPAPEDLQALDFLFNQASSKAFKPEDVDAFWDNLTDDTRSNALVNADALSFDEAFKLGLAPGEEK